MSETPVYVFNPEHDLCLANGDPNFVPPDSALRFGRDCPDIVRIIGGTDPVVAWGWDSAIKRRLLRYGYSEESLLSDARIGEIRALSHRKYALEAASFVSESFSAEGILLEGGAEELFSVEDVLAFLERNEYAVLKAPWSGSGKGLRWVRRSGINDSDLGWCRKVISSQGSVMAECRQNVLKDFAALFSVNEKEVVSEGFSLFYTGNGSYRGNILASDRAILEVLSDFVPSEVILECVDALKHFLERRFSGRYKGFVGVDMFVCEAGGQYFLAPCVEINVRMTMGLLARRYYDNFFECTHPDGDAKFVMEVLSAQTPVSLLSRLASAEALLTVPRPDSRYAVAVFKKRSIK